MTQELCTRVAFIGQVDHGKSSLLARLATIAAGHGQPVANMVRRFCADVAAGKTVELAHAVDQFAEERTGGLTIDTTEVRLSVAGRSFGLIDAPGHLELLRNMVTGTARADAAVLVVDARDGAHSQTFRHLAVATLLGCREVIVAVNKMDAVAYDEAAFERAATPIKAAFESGHEWRGTRVTAVPLSALTGEGVEGRSERLGWYGGPTVCEALLSLKAAPSLSDLPASLAIQDVYERSGVTWFVGRVGSGTLRKGMAVKTALRDEAFLIDSLLRYPDEVTAATAEQSVAMTLTPSGRLAAPRLPVRGDVLCPTDSPLSVASSLSAQLVWLDQRPLLAGEFLEIRCSTQSTRAQVLSTANVTSGEAVAVGKGAALAYGDMAQVNLLFDQPMAVGGRNLRGTALGRLVALRDGRLVAGGHGLC